MTAGLVPRAALALARAGFHSLTDLEDVTREGLAAIRGVGEATLEAVEDLLGRPLPGTPPRNNLPPPWPEMIWRRRGLHPDAAVSFVQAGMTLDRLKASTREELLAMVRVGPATIQACELLLGRPIPSRSTPADPAAAFWRSRGIPARAARALSKAGIGSPEDLREQSREELLALPGVGENALRRLEKILGTEIPSRIAFWLCRGLSLYVAHALFRAGIHTLEDLKALTPGQLLERPGLGSYVLSQCEKLRQ